MQNVASSDLEASIESCERWEWFGGGLVFAGVIATVVIAAIHPRYDSFLEQWGSAIAESLVAIGVASEIKFGQMAGLRQNELKRRSDEEVAKTTKAAAAASADAAKAKKETAEIILKHEKLKRELAWRRISELQAKQIYKQLKRKSFEITIGWTSGDMESGEYAKNFASVLDLAGLKIAAFAPFSFLGEPPAYGLSISGSEQDEIADLTTALRTASLGPVKITKDDRRPDGSKYFTHLFVGPREPPSLTESNT